MRLACLAGLKPGMRVLDLGGPARTLAAEFGCQVTVVDPIESYVRTGEALTARVRLTDRVTHRVGATRWRWTRAAACSTSSGRRTAA